MIKTFEGFSLLENVIDKFNKLAHVTRLHFNKEMERDYHILVNKFHIPCVSVISKMTPDEILDLEKDLDMIINKYPQLSEK